MLLLMLGLLGGSGGLRAGTASACGAGGGAQNGGMSQLAPASQAFGLELARRLTAGDRGNVFISPVSAQLALAMAAVGGGGPTQAAMLSTLRLGGSNPDELSRQAAADVERLTSGGCGAVEIVNSLWARQGIDLDPGYVARIEQGFSGQARTLDFSSPQAAPTINGWVADATHGKIPSIVGGHIPADVILYLINATYFHGDWAKAFDPAATQTRPFQRASGGGVQAPLMARSDRFTYGEGPDYQAIALPYRDSTLRMLVVLPRDVLRPDQFAIYLDEARFAEIAGSLVPGRQGDLRLPRFKLDGDYQLRPALEQMGMGPAFAPGADFSGISPACGSGRCAISEVQQKTHLEVDEKGTTAAAVTKTAIARSLAVLPEQLPFEMVVDRPFLAAIQDTATGALLFLGVISDPSA